MLDQIAQAASSGAGEYRWVESIVGALIGGSATAWASWVRMGRMIAVMRRDIDNVKDSFVQCQDERQSYRCIVRDDRKESEANLRTSLSERFEEVISRLERIESRLMNGGYRKQGVR